MAVSDRALPTMAWCLLSAVFRVGLVCVSLGLKGIGLRGATLDDLLRDLGGREARGEFREARQRLAEALGEGHWVEADRKVLDFERDRLRRIERDFRLTREDLWTRLDGVVRDLTPAEFAAWEREGRFDVRLIDGEQRYFVSSVSNLFHRHPELESRRRVARDRRGLERAYLENARAIRAAAREAGHPWVLPKRFRVRMAVDMVPGVAKPGDLVSAWLPFPRRFPHQSGIQLLSAIPAVGNLAPEDSPIRSVYLEQRAAADGSAHFEVEYAYTAHGVSFDLEAARVEPDAWMSDEAREFLGEAPHVRFTPEFRALAETLGGGEANAVRRARRFYDWIAENIRYSYAPEYSTVRNLSEACLSDRRGDCGQEAFVFMTLCRLTGIPARWQSGWSLFPGEQTIHDWCEIWLAPWGWVPVDPYMGVFARQYAPDLDPGQREELRDFYFGGLSQYRLAANSDHAQRLEPVKRSMRSDTVDFQRGEVEAGGANVYFDQFRYHLSWEEEGGSESPASPMLSLPETLIRQATNSPRAYARLEELCDTFGPRFSGTSELESAIDWVLDRLRKDGFEAVRGEPVAVPRWVRGEESLVQVSPRPATLPVLALGGTTNTPPEGLTAPVLVVTNFAELESRKAEARGRIVVFNAPFTSYGEIVRYRYRGAIEAAKAGALASLVRSATPFSLQTPHTGGMAYEEGVPRIPHAAITIEEAERLGRLQRRGLTPVLRLTLGAQTLPDTTSRNVVAEWRGRERPEEVIVVGGHLDSWDVGQGALDDGGGCVAAWEAIRLIRQWAGRPRRTLRLVLWTNEENGLRGARAYVAQHRSELSRHVVAIESDWGIGPVRGFAFTGSEAANRKLREGVLPRLASLEAAELKAGAGGSDLGPLLQEGVPVMDLWTDRRDYFWFHHTAADTLDKVDPVELNRCVAALAVMLHALAEMPEPLPR